MAVEMLALRAARSFVDAGVLPGPVAGPPDPDLVAAYAFGATAARAPGLRDWTWGAVAPLLLNGWIRQHAAVCARPYAHDARLVWPAVRAGWHAVATAQS